MNIWIRSEDRVYDAGGKAMTKTLKIINFLFDPNVGGPTKRSLMISSELRTLGHEIQFAFPGTDGTARAYLEDEGFKVTDLSVPKPVVPQKLKAFLNFALRSPFSILKIAKFLKREKADVIHVNGAFDILPAVAGRFARTAVVWHLNDSVFGPKLSKILGFFASRIATVVVTSAETVTDHYNVGHLKPPILSVPVDLSKYSKHQRQSDNTCTLGLLGNWNRLKGQDHFVNVVSALHESGQDVNAKMFGKFLDSQESYWEPILDKIKSSHLNQIIDCPGFVTDVPSALDEIDIMLITSASEAGPMSCVEAMACGIPVVTFDVGDVVNMLDPKGDNPCGIVVPQGDLPKMIEACNTLLKQPKIYARLAKNGPERAQRLYSIKQGAVDTLAVYLLAVSRQLS